MARRSSVTTRYESAARRGLAVVRSHTAGLESCHFSGLNAVLKASCASRIS
jgi:hypothetical protein